MENIKCYHTSVFKVCFFKQRQISKQNKTIVKNHESL